MHVWRYHARCCAILARDFDERKKEKRKKKKKKKKKNHLKSFLNFFNDGNYSALLIMVSLMVRSDG